MSAYTLTYLTRKIRLKYSNPAIGYPRRARQSFDLCSQLRFFLERPHRSTVEIRFEKESSYRPPHHRSGRHESRSFGCCRTVSSASPVWFADPTQFWTERRRL